MPLLTDKLTELAGTLADLKDRVRTALAGELARVVADAVRDVVQAVLRREPDAGPAGGGYEPVGRSWHEPIDPWADDRDPWETTGPTVGYRPVPERPPRSAGLNPDATLALAAGAAVTRWWARRTGRLAAAAGIGFAVATLGSFGPVGRAALAVIAAAADLLAVPDLLSAATSRLGRR
jgi:hypothetical protein